MPTELLTVTGVTSPNDWTLVGGGTDKVAAILDNSDSTYLWPASTSNAEQAFNISVPTFVQHGEDLAGTINGITLTFTGSRAGSGAGIFTVRTKVGSEESSEGQPVSSGGSYDWETLWTDKSITFTERPGGGAWTFDDLANLEIVLRTIGTNNGKVSKIIVSVDATLTNIINAPSGLSVLDEDFSFVQIGWTDNSGVEDGYQIQRSLDNSIWSDLGTVPADAETFTDNTVHASTTYYYRVRAFNDFFNSDWTSSVSQLVDDPSGPPETPNGLFASVITPTSVELVWFTTTLLADSFETQKSADGSTWGDNKTTEELHLIYDNLLPGSKYYFRVRAINSEGNSSYSSSISVTLPERDFRNFLENEVLQDTARYLGWKDRYNINTDIFDVTQTIPFRPNASAREMFSDFVMYHFFDGVSPQFGSIEDFRRRLEPLIAAAGHTLPSMFTPGVVTINIPFYVTSIKLSHPLTMDVPKGTVFWTSTLGQIIPGKYVRFLVGNDDVLVDHSDDEEEYFEEADVQGAKIGETVIKVDWQDSTDGVTWSSTNVGFPFGAAGGRFDPNTGALIDNPYGRGTLITGDFVVTQEVDHTVEPFDAGPIYIGIATEAILRLGYTSDGDIPAQEYQKYRDAGRVEAWRAVVYATLHRQDKVVDGTFKAFSEIHTQAVQQLELSEAIYTQRYESAVITIPSAPKIKATTYSNTVKVSF